MGKKRMFLLFVLLSICFSACKAKSYPTKPAQKKKCDCSHFSLYAPPSQSAYSICVNEK